MQEDLLKPSLDDSNDNEDTKTYDIGKLVYVAFFGGIIPTVALGTKNAKWLKVDKRIISLLIAIGVVMLAIKMFVTSIYVSKYVIIDSRMIRWGSRGAALLLYLGYYFAMKKKFKQHLFFGGATKPLLKDAIIWILIGVVIEFVLLFLVGVMSK